MLVDAYPASLNDIYGIGIIRAISAPDKRDWTNRSIRASWDVGNLVLDFGRLEACDDPAEIADSPCDIGVSFSVNFGRTSLAFKLL